MKIQKKINMNEDLNFMELEFLADQDDTETIQALDLEEETQRKKVKCVECSNLVSTRNLKLTITTINGKMKTETWYCVPRYANFSPIGVLETLECKVKGTLRFNWNVYKERECEHFKPTTDK